MAMSNNESTQVKSLARGLMILKTLAGSARGLSLAELSRAVELAPSTTHRLLDTLEKNRFVKLGSTGNWQIGTASFEVGSAFFVARDWVAALHPALAELSELGGETANLGSLDGSDVIFVGQVECREVMRMVAPLGSRAPAYASGVGKALMACLKPDAVAHCLPKSGPISITPTTLSTVEQVRADLHLSRQRGYAVDWEERNPGLRCVAAPIFDEYSEGAVAISLSGPANRMTDQRIAELGLLVNQIAVRETRALGGQWSAEWSVL